MKKYIFILGQASDLAKQELISFLELENDTESLIQDGFIIASSKLGPEELIKNLGGTIKIAEFIGEIKNLYNIEPEQFLEWLDLSPQENKLNFGLSLYHGQKRDLKFLQKIALGAKKILKQEHKQSARLVVGQNLDLSSVIVTKNKLLGRELIFILAKNICFVGKTMAVQDFENYAFRDMERPGRDSRSGMLPPKVAQMMLNLSGPKRNLTLLDPFCGSGTIIQEAALLGFEKIFGSDISLKAVNDSRENLDWLEKNYDIKSNYEISQQDVSQLEVKEKIDLIVAEPFMGDARTLQNPNNLKYIQNLCQELPKLYLTAFEQFKKISSKQAKVIFIFPIFVLNKTHFSTLPQAQIERLGWESIKPNFKSPHLSQNKNIIYQRPEQKVLREITVWQKKSS